MITSASAITPIPSTVAQFRSVRESCREVLRRSKASTGRWIPITAADIRTQLLVAGLQINERDVEAFLRDLVASGEAIEIDRDAGFRWAGEAA